MKPLPQPLTTEDRRLSRSDYNALLDVINDLRANTGKDEQGTRPGGRGLPGQVLVSATAESAVKPGEIWAIEKCAFPVTKENEQSTCLKLVKPNADDINVVVAYEPIQANAVGLVVLAGLAWCEVSIKDKAHRWVAIGESGVVATAEESGWGLIVDPAPEASSHPGTGTRWCLVRLPAGGAGAEIPITLCSVTGSASPGRRKVREHYMVADDRADNSPNWGLVPGEKTVRIELGDEPLPD